MAEIPSTADIADALALLTPCETSLAKVRVGNPLGDGGYVLADRLKEGQKVYSYGISQEVSFDLALAKRGLVIFMYDHTIDGLVADHPKFNFFRQGIGQADDPAASLYTLAHHINSNGHDDNDMLLKMDVEGAEWAVLDAIEPSILSRFEQITLEFHALGRLGQAAFLDRFRRVFDKLAQAFNLIHVHANNTSPILSIAGLQVPAILEVSFLRKDIGDVSPWRSVVPTDLDAPNVRKPDHILAFFPFLPTAVSADEVRSGVLEATRRARMRPAERIANLALLIPVRGRNIATKGQCRQSSLSNWSTGPDEANAAVRGEKSGHFSFHTGIEKNPRWQVDLGKIASFDEIVCYNRLGPCAERARNLIVEISADGLEWDVIHTNSNLFGGIDGNPLRVTRPRTSARHVRLRLPGETALHLDAVEIYDWEAP